ncbi:cytochrome c oxidase assembly protein [Roseateles asaccharophilus]|uniref:Membrane protein n=1 Tax=Roseateles asaccharophilus TaxID=582607 RepID=A0ABU2AFA9_9BURK|nr:cytochrome c oxidase assembly protein [Roseateles asaccharophilus]MDR7335293.1 putative membrane protein [Roseateles asaccharophilus]
MDDARRWIPYCGEAPGPSEWLGRWNLDPVLLAALALLALALWWPGAKPRVALRWAWALAVLLYVSPLCALSSAFFTVRVAHHMALVLAIAPLAAFGLAPRRVPLWTSTAVATAVFWLWHVPAPYAAALSSNAIYALMQLSLLASATVFWMAVRRAAPAAAMGAILVTMVLMGLLGALILFAAQPLYEPHIASTLAWGVSPLEDQQLAGLLMWAPGSLAYLAAALAIGWRWLQAERGLKAA